MKQISVADDIVPIAEFKTSLSKWFKNVQESGRPLVITQNGKPSGVLLSPRDYDDLVYRRSLLESVERGLNEVESGKAYTTEELVAALAAKRKIR